MLDVNMHEKLVSLYNCIRFTFKYHSVFHKINLLYICYTCIYVYTYIYKVFFFSCQYTNKYMYYIFFFKFRFIYWYIPARQYVTYISYFLGTDSCSMQGSSKRNRALQDGRYEGPLRDSNL